MISPIIKLITIPLAVFALGSSARALIINVTYDTSVTSSPEAAQIESAYNWVVQTYENQFTNAITVNITVYWGGGGNLGQVGLGESYTSAVGQPGFGYPQVVAALSAARNSAYDSNSVASLPASDPTGGGTWFIPSAEAKAIASAELGIDPNDPMEDGEVGFGTNDVSYTFDPTNRVVPGEYDFIGVAEHETTEAMGRTNFGLDQNGNYIPFDLFRYTGSGAESLAYYATSVYFSIDGGVTDLKDFNDGSDNGDVQDWADSSPADAYDWSISAGEKGNLSTVDFIAMDILGYNSPGIQSAPVSGILTANGHFQLTFTNLAATSFSVLASTNVMLPVSSWTVLGTAVEYPVGHYTFTDSQGVKQRFYRIRSP
jgi:hypothetical protein